MPQAGATLGGRCPGREQHVLALVRADLAEDWFDDRLSPGVDALASFGAELAGHPYPPCRVGSTPTAGDASHPRKAAAGCGSCSDSRALRCSHAATTTGTRAATHESRSPGASPRGTTGARRARSPRSGSGKPSGISARCWRSAPCAGRPSARNGSGVWSASIGGSRTPSTTPTTSSATSPRD